MTIPNLRALLPAVALFAALASPTSASAQDLYDPAVLRTINLQFRDANWLALLRQNYASEVLILADLTVDNVVYPDVGVRIRGNTSYTALPAGSEKFSLKVELDYVNPNQEVQGYDTLNLNNGFRDPTFSREVVYNNFVGQYIPNIRANNVILTLNGQNWGVYINVQQGDKRMLADYFDNSDGTRISCSNNPNGPGLQYAGANPSSYAAYEINNTGGLADPWTPFIGTLQAISTTPIASITSIDNVFAIDPSTWSVVLENLLTDDDSYVNKGCDFVTYRDPADDRLHLIQRDANETFTASAWTFDRNFSATNKPVLSRVLAHPELRQRYLAHYRSARARLNWSYFGPIFTARRTLIDAAVQADPKKLYSYTLFQNNFTSTVNMPLSGLAGGNIVGLQQFVDARATALNGVAELNGRGPIIAEETASPTQPLPGAPVTITARVTPDGNPVGLVYLYYRPLRAQPFQRVAMLDNGSSGDGAAGDGVYGVILPVTGTAGQKVDWYVGASTVNTWLSQSYAPALTERGAHRIEYALLGAPGMRITEWMYSGVSGEFIEFTNLGSTAIDLSGWSMDDAGATPGAFSLSAAGVLQPGQSVVVTEAPEASFRTAWNLSAAVKVIGDLGLNGVGNNLGRNDQIHLYNASSELIDRLNYGDQTFAGSIRTQERSGQVPCEAIGQDNVMAWVLSTVGDAYGTTTATTGERGTPGSFVLVGNCEVSPVLFADGFE